MPLTSGPPSTSGGGAIGRAGSPPAFAVPTSVGFPHPAAASAASSSIETARALIPAAGGRNDHARPAGRAGSAFSAENEAGRDNLSRPAGYDTTQPQPSYCAARITLMSVRRLSWRPDSVVLLATGLLLPWP